MGKKTREKKDTGESVESLRIQWQHRLTEKEKQINNGDLLAITTTVEGLDIGHVGIAVKMDNGKIHLLHAPTVSAKVQITEEPLSVYLQKYNRHSGVIVLRALEWTK